MDGVSWVSEPLDSLYAVIGRCQCEILWCMDCCESRIKDGGLRMNGMAIEYWGSGFSFIANHEFFYLMAILLLSGVMGLKWIMPG